MRWPVVPLATALTATEMFVDGDWVESKDQDPKGDVRLVQLADIGDGEYLDKSSRFLTSERARELRCTFLMPGDVLVARMPDPLGRSCIFPGDAKPSVTAVDVCIIRPGKKGPDAGFLMRCLNSPAIRAQIAGFATGTTRSRISRSNLSRIKIPLPPLPEQRRIAEVLDRAQALRAKRRTAIAQLDALTESIFLDVFGDPATNPKRWALSPLKQCTKRIQIGPFGSLLHQDDYVPGGVPLINPMHIQEGVIVPDPDQSVTASKHAELRLYHLRQGDVIMGRRGEMGRCAIVSPEHDGFVCGTGSLFIRPDPEFATALYLAATLASAGIRGRLERSSLGATLPNLNRGIVEDLVIPVPPMSSQNDFANRVAAVEKLKSASRASLAELDALFASLQQRAFRGEL